MEEVSSFPKPCQPSVLSPPTTGLTWRASRSALITSSISLQITEEGVRVGVSADKVGTVKGQCGFGGKGEPLVRAGLGMQGRGFVILGGGLGAGAGPMIPGRGSGYRVPLVRLGEEGTDSHCCVAALREDAQCEVGFIAHA